MAHEGLYTVQEALQRIESKVDKILDDHEERIRSLERWKWGLPASLVAAMAAFFGSFFGLRH